MKINHFSFVIFLASTALSLIPFGTILVGYLIAKNSAKKELVTRFLVASAGVILSQGVALQFEVMRIFLSLFIMAAAIPFFLPKQKKEELSDV
ncbi:hypothetical protein EOM09_03135 [bacterium]|nr:hypothetical protein [bacterium]